MANGQPLREPACRRVLLPRTLHCRGGFALAPTSAVALKGPQPQTFISLRPIRRVRSPADSSYRTQADGQRRIGDGLPLRPEHAIPAPRGNLYPRFSVQIKDAARSGDYEGVTDCGWKAGRKNAKQASLSVPKGHRALFTSLPMSSLHEAQFQISRSEKLWRMSTRRSASGRRCAP